MGLIKKITTRKNFTSSDFNFENINQNNSILIELTRTKAMSKKEIENHIVELEKERLEAIKIQDYAHVAVMRDRVREMMYKLREL